MQELTVAGKQASRQIDKPCGQFLEKLFVVCHPHTRTMYGFNFVNNDTFLISFKKKLFNYTHPIAYAYTV